MYFFNDDDEWVFTDDECEAPCINTYCVALWWDLLEWKCGYMNMEDYDASGFFIGGGKTPEEAIAHTWLKIQENKPYQRICDE